MSQARFGLIGRRLSHSFSPQIHKLWGDYPYELIPLEPEALQPFLQGGSFTGLNVTIPYKKAAMQACQSLSPAAARIGCVNTILRRKDGSLYGHNTDYDGLYWLLTWAKLPVAGKKVLILGSGGASLTARTVAADMGAGAVIVISRSGPENYTNLERHRDAGLIINTTPVGMYPDNGKSPVELSGFPALKGVCDLIYNPARTKLLLDAQRQGIPCVGGLGMLVAQARAAAELFQDKKLPESLTPEITAQIRRETENLLLIGMPGCGKSSLGALLAQRLGRRLVDSDGEIVARAGKSIPEIFQAEGEAGFRSLEHQVLEALCKESGLVIAAGGGVVTRQENWDLLRQNSFVVFIRRALDSLPTAGRPISQSRSLADIYKERLPLYQALADCQVENNSTLEAAVLEIERKWQQS